MKYLKLFEKFDGSLIESIKEDDYFSWQQRIIGPPKPEDIIIIRGQVSKIEASLEEEYYKQRERVWGNMYEYHRKPENISKKLWDNVYKIPTDLYVKISLCDDEWYIIDIYSMWHHYYFLCDTSDGLNGLADVVIQKLEF